MFIPNPAIFKKYRSDIFTKYGSGSKQNNRIRNLLLGNVSTPNMQFDASRLCQIK